MHKKVRQDFPVSLEDLLRAREERSRNLTNNPEYKKVEVISDEIVNGKRTRTRLMHIDSEIPDVLKKLMPGNVPGIEEVSVFNDDDNSHTFKLTVPGHPKAFTIEGVSTYTAVDDNNSYREYDMQITSKMMIVAPVVERAIWSFHERNMNKDRDNLIRFIETGEM